MNVVCRICSNKQSILTGTGIYRLSFYSRSRASGLHLFDKAFQVTGSVVYHQPQRNYALLRKSSGIDVAGAQNFWIKKFIENSVPEPEASIKYILGSILGLKNVDSLFKIRNRILSDDENALLKKMTHLRLERMPIQYIIGEWDFCDLTLKMSHTPSVFIPRPETEELVQIASELILSLEKGSKSQNVHCLEIGCGSGAISLGLLSKNDKLVCTAVDANPSAVSIAKINSQRLGFSNRASFLDAKLEENGELKGILPFDQLKFDILVSNPPYIPSSEIAELAPEISRYEDHLALDGGSDGTNLIQTILRYAPGWLKGDSFIVLEIDPRQIERIQLISQQNGSYVGDVDVRKDCFGVERFVILKCQ